MTPFRIEVLAQHSRQDFTCGNAALDHYFIERAGQDQRRLCSVCYVAIEKASNAITSYYTLSSSSIQLTELPSDIAKKLRRYPVIPAVRIGRLAITKTHQGQGLGGGLLADAFRRVRGSGIGAYAIVVDAIDDAAEAFYRHHGFTSLQTELASHRTLFISLANADNETTTS